MARDSYGLGMMTMDGWIRRLRSMPEMVGAAVPQVADMVQSELSAAMAASRNVDGSPWRPIPGGGKPLKNLASALTMRIAGRVITWTITGHHVFHEIGTGRLPRRALLPKGGLPDKLGNQIRKGLITMGMDWLQRKGRHDKGSGGVRMQPRMGA